MMPIITQLKSGDIIEVITSDNSKGPSRDWLKFVKSTKAKNKIQYAAQESKTKSIRIELVIKRMFLYKVF